MTTPNYPSNSHSRRANQPVVTGNVRHRKATIGRGIVRAFTDSDNGSLSDHILADVIFPSIRSLLAEIVSETGGFITDIVESKLLSPDHRGSGYRSRGRTDYGGRSRTVIRRDETYRGRGDSHDRRIERNRTKVWDTNDIVVDSRIEAEEVLSRLRGLITEYGTATVGDYHEFIGIREISPVSQLWGWTDLRTASVTRNREGGYRIILPQTENLE